MNDAKRFIDKNTLIIVDPTDVCKPHAQKMEHLTIVRDASRSSKDNAVTTRGYHGCMAVACKSGSRKTVPLALKLWSSNADGHKGENDEVLAILREIDRITDGKGIMSAIVLATTYFTAAWLGRGVRKDVLVAHIERMHQRFNEVPEFFLYALADGIRRAFSRYGRWETKAVTSHVDDTQPDLPGWDELAFVGAG